MSRVMRIDEACHSYEEGMSHTNTHIRSAVFDAANKAESAAANSYHVTHMNESCYTYE